MTKTDAEKQQLTPAESEVQRLVALGLSNKQIAFELSFEETTAKAHVSHILRKIGATNRVQIALEFYGKWERAA